MALANMVEGQLWQTGVLIIALALLAVARRYAGERVKNGAMSLLSEREEAKSAHEQIPQLADKMDEVGEQVSDIDDKVNEIEEGQRALAVSVIHLQGDENGIDEEELRERVGVDEMDTDLIDDSGDGDSRARP